MECANKSLKYDTYEENDDIYEYVLVRAGLLENDTPVRDESCFTDNAHPLACYVSAGGLDKEHMKKISRLVRGALHRIQEREGISTRAELAANLGVGKNQPREWENHPERIDTVTVKKICDLSKMKLETLRGLYKSDVLMKQKDGLPRFRFDELQYFYGLLTDEQQAVITRMIYEMDLANRMRAVYAGNYRP